MSLYAAGLQLSALSPLISISPFDGRVYKKSVSLRRRRWPRGTPTSNSNASPCRPRFFADFSRWRRSDSTSAAAGKFSSPLVARSAARPAVSVILPAATQPSPKLVPASRALTIRPNPVPSRLVAHLHPPSLPPPPPYRRCRPLEPAELTIPPSTTPTTQPPTRASPTLGRATLRAAR